MDTVTSFIGNVTGTHRTNEDGTPVVYTPVRNPIIPMRMQGQLPPYPPPPTNFMTDAEIHLNRQNNRLVENQKLSTNINEGIEDLTGEGKSAGTRAKGLWGVLANGVKKGIVEVQIGAHSTVQATTTHSQHQRYQNAFSHIAQQGAEFHSSHEGHVVHQGRDLPCGVFVTSTHLCINGSGLTDAIPFTNVVSIMPCVNLPTVDLTPFLMPIPNVSVIPTACEVFVRAQSVEGQDVEFLKYQLLGFTDSSMKQMIDSSTRQFGPCIKFLADLDKSWRHCTTVPVPNMQYQQGYNGSQSPLVAGNKEPAMADDPPPHAVMGGFAGRVQNRDLNAEGSESGGRLVSEQTQEALEKQSAPLPDDDQASPPRAGGGVNTATEEQGTVPTGNQPVVEEEF